MTDKPSASFNEHAANDNLPIWDLDTLFGYDGYKSDSFEAEWSQMETLVQDFIAEYEERVDALSGDELAEALQKDQEISGLANKIISYIGMKNVQDSAQYGADYADVMNRARELFTPLSFFSHELKQISEADIHAKIDQSEVLKDFSPMIEDTRRGIPHTPSLEIQQYSGEMASSSAWSQLYQDRQVMLRFPFEGEELKRNEIVNIMYNDPDAERRKEANAVFEDVLKGEAWLNTRIHNELIRQNMVSGKWANFENPADSRHFSNNIEPEVVDALEKAVKDAYPRTSHRFYKLKAKLMGQEKLGMHDRNINIFEGQDEPKITWDEARDIVVEAYKSFSPEIAEVVEKFFDNGWIDAKPGQNKADGAFSSSGPAQLMHPLIMMNFKGTARDVATLAHELGHGVHQYLAANKGDKLVGTPLTLAETASVFGEMLTFKSLLAKADNDDQRRKMLFEKVNDMLATVVRQISFYDFEKRVHNHYREHGPLKEEDFNKHWVDCAQDSYGPALPVDDSYGPVFGYIPHIVKTQFYVYAYAFGDSLVNALYQVYEEGTIPDEEFKEKYTAMLEAGGTYSPEKLKEDFGLDIRDPAFWDKGLNVIENLINELEDLCEPLLNQDLDADQDRGYIPAEPIYFDNDPTNG